MAHRLGAPAPVLDGRAQARLVRLLRQDAVQTAAAMAAVTGRTLVGPGDWSVQVDPSGEAIIVDPGRLVVPATVLRAAAARHPVLPGPPVGAAVDPYPWSALVAAAARTLFDDPSAGSARWPAQRDVPSIGELPHRGPDEQDTLLTAILVAAGDQVGPLTEALAAQVAADTLHRAVRAAFVATLAHPAPARAAGARRRAGGPAGSAWLLPELATAFDRCGDPQLRSVLAEAHHRIGKRALSAPDPRAVTPIMRSTHHGRFHELDRLIAELTRAASDPDGGPEEMHGVDLAALRAGIDGRSGLRIRDEAVSDGQTTVDLWRALTAAGVRGALVAGDRFSAYDLVGPVHGVHAVYAPDGRCLQVESVRPTGLPGVAPRSSYPDAPPGPVPGGASSRHHWVTPYAREIPPSAALRVEFREHDVFTPDPEPAHLIRVCGLLYRRVRPDVDAESYFTAEDIQSGLGVLGAGLTPGGVLVVGSVIDAVDGSFRHTDADFFQRTGSGSAPVLRHRARIGVGLGDGIPAELPLTASTGGS